MAAISIINNGEAMSSVRSKLNNVITEINLLDPTDWIDYSSTSTIVGWSVLPIKIIRYRVIGKMVFVNVNLNGTSNNATTTFTLPFQNKNIEPINMAYVANNGSTLIGAFGMIANSSICTCYQNFSSAWTASGTKYIYGQFFYEIA
jgi:hypothetical protein